MEGLAAEHGLSHLRVAEGGLIVARLEGGRDYVDLGAFDSAVHQRTGIAVHSHPEEVLARPGHSPELDEAEEL